MRSLVIDEIAVIHFTWARRRFSLSLHLSLPTAWARPINRASWANDARTELIVDDRRVPIPELDIDDRSAEFVLEPGDATSGEIYDDRRTFVSLAKTSEGVYVAAGSLRELAAQVWAEPELMETGRVRIGEVEIDWLLAKPELALALGLRHRFA
jgi:hypothetical protein